MNNENNLNNNLNNMNFNNNANDNNANLYVSQGNNGENPATFANSDPNVIPQSVNTINTSEVPNMPNTPPMQTPLMNAGQSVSPTSSFESRPIETGINVNPNLMSNSNQITNGNSFVGGNTNVNPNLNFAQPQTVGNGGGIVPNVPNHSNRSKNSNVILLILGGIVLFLMGFALSYFIFNVLNDKDTINDFEEKNNSTNITQTSNDNNNNGNNNDNNTQKDNITYKGFSFNKLSNYAYAYDSVSDVLYVSNNQILANIMDIYQIDFSYIEAIKDTLISTLEQSGYTVTSVKSQKINGKDVMSFNVSLLYEGKTLFGIYTIVSHENYLFEGIVSNNSNIHNEADINNLVEIISNSSLANNYANYATDFKISKDKLLDIMEK